MICTVQRLGRGSASVSKRTKHFGYRDQAWNAGLAPHCGCAWEQAESEKLGTQLDLGNQASRPSWPKICQGRLWCLAHPYGCVEASLTRLERKPSVSIRNRNNEAQKVCYPHTERWVSFNPQAIYYAEHHILHIITRSRFQSPLDIIAVTIGTSCFVLVVTHPKDLATIGPMANLVLILIIYFCVIAVDAVPAEPIPPPVNQPPWDKQTIFTLVGIFVGVVTIIVMVFLASSRARLWCTSMLNIYKFGSS
jgi:hypothetical protein